MSLSISGRIVADVRIQTVALREIVGAYELVFPLYITVHAAGDRSRHGRILGARVTVRGDADSEALGFARPEGEVAFVSREHRSSLTPALVLVLQPGQLAALEVLRGSGDLDFELLASGVGLDEDGEQNLQEQWRIHVPRSAWIKQLSGARARDVLLLEIPIPLGELGPLRNAGRELQRAEERFRNGDYHACIAACRSVVDELGYGSFQKQDWAGPLLDRLASDRRKMTQNEREAALWGALRHYAHQAHHGDSEGGVGEYSRAEAQFVLILTATFARHARGG